MAEIDFPIGDKITGGTTTPSLTGGTIDTGLTGGTIFIPTGETIDTSNRSTKIMTHYDFYKCIGCFLGGYEELIQEEVEDFAQAMYESGQAMDGWGETLTSTINWNDMKKGLVHTVSTCSEGYWYKMRYNWVGNNCLPDQLGTVYDLTTVKPWDSLIGIELDAPYQKKLLSEQTFIRPDDYAFAQHNMLKNKFKVNINPSYDGGISPSHVIKLGAFFLKVGNETVWGSSAMNTYTGGTNVTVPLQHFFANKAWMSQLSLSYNISANTSTTTTYRLAGPITVTIKANDNTYPVSNFQLTSTTATSVSGTRTLGSTQWDKECMPQEMTINVPIKRDITWVNFDLSNLWGESPYNDPDVVFEYGDYESRHFSIMLDSFAAGTGLANKLIGIGSNPNSWSSTVGTSYTELFFEVWDNNPDFPGFDDEPGFAVARINKNRILNSTSYYPCLQLSHGGFIAGVSGSIVIGPTSTSYQYRTLAQIRTATTTTYYFPYTQTCAYRCFSVDNRCGYTLLINGSRFYNDQNTPAALPPTLSIKIDGSNYTSRYITLELGDYSYDVYINATSYNTIHWSNFPHGAFTMYIRE